MSITFQLHHHRISSALCFQGTHVAPCASVTSSTPHHRLVSLWSPGVGWGEMGSACRTGGGGSRRLRLWSDPSASLTEFVPTHWKRLESPSEALAVPRRGSSLSAVHPLPLSWPPKAEVTWPHCSPEISLHPSKACMCSPKLDVLRLVDDFSPVWFRCQGHACASSEHTNGETHPGLAVGGRA